MQESGEDKPAKQAPTNAGGKRLTESDVTAPAEINSPPLETEGIGASPATGSTPADNPTATEPAGPSASQQASLRGASPSSATEEQVRSAQPSWLTRAFSAASTFWKIIGGVGFLGAAWIAFLVIQDLRTDIVFRLTGVPASLKSQGVEPGPLLEKAIDGVRPELESHRTKLRDGQPYFASAPQIVTIGNETYCSDATYKRLVTFMPEYFSGSKILKSADMMNDREFQFPGADQLLSFVRWISGKPFTVVTMNIFETDRGYQLETIVDVVNGATPGNERLKSLKDVIKPDAVTVEAMVREVALRVAYPELTALVRNVKYRSDLDIEEFEARAFPSADRDATVNFGMFVALMNHPVGTSPGTGFQRATIAAKRALNAKTPALVVLDEFEIGLVTLRGHRGLMTMYNSVDSETANFLNAVEDEMIANRAAELHLDPAKLFGDGVNVAGLDSRARLLSEINAASRLMREPTAQNVSAYRGRVDRILAEYKPAYSGIALHDSALTYAIGAGILINPDLTKEVTDPMRDALQGYVRFNDSVLPDGIMDPPDREMMEMIAMLVQLRLGYIDDAISRSRRFANNSSPCALAEGGRLLSGLATILNIDFEKKTRLQSSGLAMLQRAERDGVKNFGLFNEMGIAAGRLREFGMAQSAFSEAVRYNGERDWAFLNSGSDYLENSMFPEAQQAYENSINASVARCKKEIEDWGDIDDEYNATADQIFRENATRSGYNPDDRNPYLISHSTNEKDCGVTKAVTGLLSSLKAQNDGNGYARVYREYLSDVIYFQVYPDIVRSAVSELKQFQCAGTLEDLPPIASALANEFHISEGRFACDDTSVAPQAALTDPSTKPEGER